MESPYSKIYVLFMVHHLIWHRADAEEKYGKSLIRIAESAKGKEEIG